MEVSCIVNPLSGGRKGERLIQALEGLNGQNGTKVKILRLTWETPVEELEQAFSGPKVLLAGGDGTVSGMLKYALESKAEIGLLPLGTGNDLAKELGVFKLFSLERPEQIISFYESAASVPFTVWELLPQDGSAIYFCNYVSFGFDAKIVADFSNWRDSQMSQPK